ncbi:hypothetical protein AlacWU_08020, partial [Aspergillus niger]
TEDLRQVSILSSEPATNFLSTPLPFPPPITNWLILRGKLAGPFGPCALSFLSR